MVNFATVSLPVSRSLTANKYIPLAMICALPLSKSQACTPPESTLRFTSLLVVNQAASSPL